jgi:hypothetical protein
LILQVVVLGRARAEVGWFCGFELRLEEVGTGLAKGRGHGFMVNGEGSGVGLIGDVIEHGLI